jgi:hypothetical protein
MAPYPRDPWTWFDVDPTSDPTVHVPYRIRLVRTSGTTVDVHALWVRITHGHGVSFGPDPEDSVPLTGIASGHIDIVPVPADLARLRERYAWAYRTWRADEAVAVFQWIRDGIPAAELADRLRRPPDHILTKAARVDALLRAARQLAQPVTPPDYPRDDPDRPTSHRQFDPPPWYAVARGDDPTVHLPCDLHLDLAGAGAITVTPVDGCSLDEEGVEYRTDASTDRVRLGDITTGRVGIRPVPADLTRLRETYPFAYGRWPRRHAKDVLQGGRQESGMPLDRLVEELSRPPEHILAKYVHLESVAAAIVREPRTEPAPYLKADIEGSGSWAVAVYDVCPPRVVADRHGVVADHITTWGTFLAVLTDEQITALRGDPDVESVEKLGGVALC